MTVLYEDPLREGVITNLYRNGVEVFDPEEATLAIVQVLEGRDAGWFIVVEFDFDGGESEFEEVTRH